MSLEVDAARQGKHSYEREIAVEDEKGPMDVVLDNAGDDEKNYPDELVR